MKFAFAGDRNISCKILKFIMDNGYNPSALLVSNDSDSSHAKELIELANLDKDFIFTGKSFKQPSSIELLESLELDYIFGIHFRYIIPEVILKIPKIGFLNLHPAYLPYNKGWHTPSWAIMDKTPYGATLHFMTAALDQGDIVHQREIKILPQDTADSLYQRVLKLEERVFYEAYDDLIKLQPKRIPQKGKGTSHAKRDLQHVQEINLNEEVKAIDLIDKIRALTTNKISELPFIRVGEKRFGIQINFVEIDE